MGGGGGFDDGADFVVDHAGKHQRMNVLALGGGIDLRNKGVGFFGAVNKGMGAALERKFAKLFQQGVAHVFGSEACAVGNEEYGAGGGGHGISFVDGVGG